MAKKQRRTSSPAKSRRKPVVSAANAAKPAVAAAAVATVAATGLQVIYVHGMNRKPKPADLKREWDTALFGRPIGERTRVAYWADILHDPAATEGASAEAIGPKSTGPTAALRREVLGTTGDAKAAAWAETLQQKMLAESAGRSEASLAKAFTASDHGRSQTTFTPRILPSPWLRKRATELITRQFIKDVAAYFFDDDIGQAIRDRLRDLLIPGRGPYVLVTHSMGTMIAYDVLHDLADTVDVRLWVTLGSPLGIEEVQDKLAQPLIVPKGVKAWRNFSDRLDPVALDASLSDEYKPHGTVVDDFVLNPHTLRLSDFNPHSGTGYLSHPAVQQAVRAVVGAGFASPTPGFVMAADLAAEAAGPPKRHRVLIQLDENVAGDDLAARGRKLEQRLKQLTKGDATAQIDVLERYVGVRLTPGELEQLRAEHKELSIHRLWKNSRKRALLNVSTHRIQAHTAQIGYRATGRNICWAVLDTGINDQHPHFTNQSGQSLIAGQFDCTQPGKKPQNGSAPDRHGHGTHVAGIISGREQALPPGAPERDLYLGIAPETKLQIYKVLDDNGEGDDSSIIKALDHIARQNESAGRLVIHGVNLSLGGPFDPEAFGCGHSPLCQELRRLWRMGVVVCLAAGNEGVTDVAAFSADGQDLEVLPLNTDLSIGDPANLEDAIAIGSVHKESPHLYGVSYFSSRGPTADGRQKPDVVAPGEKIVSCNAEYDPVKHPDAPPYVEMSGTSMACPHVSGLIAGFLSVRREFIGRPDELKRLLLQHAIDLGRNAYHQGAGMPNLIAMLAGT